ncbi:AAA-domain-containing protein [Desarmillaria ectypa]|nr:AAA-domain-containing protein [Desarmillaria ectypa]
MPQPSPVDQHASQHTLPLPQKVTLRIRPMVVQLRRSSRHSRGSESGPSGSEYHDGGSDKSSDDQLSGPPADVEEPPAPELTKTRSGRTVAKHSYAESDDDPVNGEVASADQLFNDVAVGGDDGDDEEEEHGPRRTGRKTRNLSGFVVEDDDDKERIGPKTRLRSRKEPPRPTQAEMRSVRAAKRATRNRNHDADYEAHTSSGASASADGSIGDAPGTSSDLEPPETHDADDADGDQDMEEGDDGKPYALRQRQRINYAIPPPLEEMSRPPLKPSKSHGGRNGYGGGRKPKGLGWSASGAELSKWMGMGGAGDDSDSDAPTRTPRKRFGMGAFDGGVGTGGNGLIPPDFAAAGTPSNLGKITDAALADADPLGVNVNVTFDEVGGLDDHIHSLKEMTLLPLLYPEVFQRFNVTPPRGVLFHGPPGTGKTLLARALAASCRSNGKQISFFMRKGADALSKWVGEAERQLRLLFEEARACQPSIIFFDEIDGLAPVRSSKQDQIHASIVSTLLALMDGMDGRGQVIVIGATNRPDAIDPALRRPGRFDREFYFPLPKIDAREKILNIMTKDWEGWSGEDGLEKIKGLAKMTKGYGGADLRALCTEAALNAVQRKYPQIYKSNDRLLLKPETIGVGLRDFMISIKKMIPSSARATSSSATPLPSQFEPLLSETFEKAKAVIERVLPVEKKLSALEEAEYDDDDEAGALERELLSQSMATLRIHRPRMLLYGPPGMGQGYIGAAILHHLEGYHVQSLELGTLMGDSTRTVEAAVVQLFVEAKRHQPSVIYIPSLVGWCAAVSETSRSTVRAMLDTLAPTDPVLLLAIVDGRFTDLPGDVRSWFGPTKDNRVELFAPTIIQREQFFDSLIKDIRRPPTMFADGIKRKKRVLEELPLAPPPEPRQPTEAEIAMQIESDRRVITSLKSRLGPILTDLKRKFKRFTKRATDEYPFDMFNNTFPEPVVNETVPANIEGQAEPNGVIQITTEEQPPQPPANGHVNGIVPGSPAPEQVAPRPQLYDFDLERMHIELYNDRYLTPQDFLDDIGKIVHNAAVCCFTKDDHERLLKAQALFTTAEVIFQDFDPHIRAECERMAPRERKRREEHRKNKQKEKGKATEAAVVAARRSARNNGQQPELALTDPVRLERSLKRQRADGQAIDSNGSEEENGEGHDAKRTKLLDGDADGDADADGDPDDTDPLNLVASPRVRFEVPPFDQPMQSIPTMQPLYPQVPNGQPTFNQQGAASLYPQSSMFPFPEPATHHGIPLYMPERSMSSYQPTPSMSSSYPNGQSMYGTGQPMPYMNQQPMPSYGNQHSMPSFSDMPSYSHAQPVPAYTNAQPEVMVVDPVTTRPSNFNSILNPVPVGTSDMGQWEPNPPIARPSTIPPAPIHDTENPFAPEVNLSARDLLTAPKSVSPVPEKEPSPIPIERTPTPLPEFHVDEGLISQLQGSLRGNTSSLTVEQLEQLRATCLGCVWRHRSAWDRDSLLRELQDIVSDFVEEVGQDNAQLDEMA